MMIILLMKKKIGKGFSIGQNVLLDHCKSFALRLDYVKPIFLLSIRVLVLMLLNLSITLYSKMIVEKGNGLEVI